jgi:hypothetical protein
MRSRVAVVALWLAGALAAGAVFPACTTPRDALGTNASPCFQSLPVAADAVHERGTLHGVRLIDAKTLASHALLRSVLSVQAGAPVGTVCAFSYQGSYTLAQVQKPLGAAPAGGTGQYAVVLVSMPQNELLATFVLAHEPFRFRHNL